MVKNSSFMKFSDFWLTYKDFIFIFFILGLLILVMRIFFKKKDGISPQEQLLSALIKEQSEMKTRLHAVFDMFQNSQNALGHNMSKQLGDMHINITKSLHQHSLSTKENLAKLQERLALIDNAQSNIQSLAGQMVQLQNILSNKQTRGAFGQKQMEAIIRDALPEKLYSFQATLPNKTRPDCVIYMPNDAPCLVIDSKFPLESWSRHKDAQTEHLKQQACNAFKQDMDVHIRAIAEKYLIFGETQEVAFLFVPSESIFATLHEKFDSVVQKAFRQRVIIVSPSLLLLSISLIQSIYKDAHMREQAHLIQQEVHYLIDDIRRLDERVNKVQTHFNQTVKDIEDITTSTKKIKKRGDKITQVDLEEASPESIIKSRKDKLSCH